MSIPPQSSAAPGMRGMILMGFTIGIQTKRSSVWTPELTVILPSIRWDRQRRKEPSNKVDRVRWELQSNPRDHLLQCCSPSSLLWLFDPFFRTHTHTLSPPLSVSSLQNSPGTVLSPTNHQTKLVCFPKDRIKVPGHLLEKPSGHHYVVIYSVA